MDFQKYDLGHRTAGEIVEITLVGNGANVRLMDSSNFSSYRSGVKTPLLWQLYEALSCKASNSAFWSLVCCY